MLPRRLPGSRKNEAAKEDSKEKCTSRPCRWSVQLGRLIDSKQNVIQMKDIEGEERSVVVEGYVFNAEIRELRSGRQLLTFEITDYTSSFCCQEVLT